PQARAPRVEKEIPRGTRQARSPRRCQTRARQPRPPLQIIFLRWRWRGLPLSRDGAHVLRHDGAGHPPGALGRRPQPVRGAQEARALPPPGEEGARRPAAEQEEAAAAVAARGLWPRVRARWADVWV